MFTHPQSINRDAADAHQANACASAHCRTNDNLPRLDQGSSRLAAEMYAVRRADECGVPQTVFRNPQVAGWWHTNPFASILINSEIFITILPSRYFH